VATVVAHSRAVACASIQTSTRHAAGHERAARHDEGCPPARTFFRASWMALAQHIR